MNLKLIQKNYSQRKQVNKLPADIHCLSMSKFDGKQGFVNP